MRPRIHFNDKENLKENNILEDISTLSWSMLENIDLNRCVLPMMSQHGSIFSRMDRLTG